MTQKAIFHNIGKTASSTNGAGKTGQLQVICGIQKEMIQMNL